MKYFAHRGAWAELPANSLPAFAKAREVGCTCYELDVHMTLDGSLVVHHDYSLATDTTSQRDIKEITFNEIKQCRLLHSFDPYLNIRPPLLREIFPIIVDQLEILNIEIKNDNNVYPGIEEALWKELDILGPEVFKKVLISSFDYATLQRVRQIAPQAKIGVLTRLFEPQKIRSLSANSVHINKTLITKEIVDICHSEGREVYVYTINDKYTLRSLQRIGVDGIFTDRPELFLPQKEFLPEDLVEKYTPLKLSKKTRVPRL